MSVIESKKSAMCFTLFSASQYGVVLLEGVEAKTLKAKHFPKCFRSRSGNDPIRHYGGA